MAHNDAMLAHPALYVHIPWCVRKCPYCDFNSHALNSGLPEEEYLSALQADLESDIREFAPPPFASVFFGGGTPSLLSPAGVAAALDRLAQAGRIESGAEITLEANPASSDAARFAGYRAAGVNRLSVGVQSFDAEVLGALGRVHGRSEAVRAVRAAARHFDTFNVDLMYGAPRQTLASVVADLEQAAALEVPHLSWYQLTIERNTEFWRRPPALPDEDLLDAMEDAGLARLDAAGLRRYEVSAFARPGHGCRHNINYWTFGDYLGIGAGAHGKVTTRDGVVRTRKTRTPGDYLSSRRRLIRNVTADELPGEFMMNALRLIAGSDLGAFEARTGLAASTVYPTVTAAARRGWMQPPPRLAATPLGLRFLDSLIQEFL